MSLEEVAKRAGVSTATVSRVLNNVAVVRSSTRSRVIKAVAELNYHPNLHARTLAGGKSRTLGMIASNMENPFFIDILRTLEDDARLHGYDVVVANTGYQSDLLSKSVRLMIGRRVAGLAAIVSEMDPGLIGELTASKTPVVFYDVGTVTKNISNIRVNYQRGIERIVEYLHDLGHSRLAYVGHHSTLGPTSEREKSFVEAVTRIGPASEWRSVADQDSFEGGWRAMAEILASGFRPTAVICVNDFMAMGVLRQLRERAMCVPKEVSVTGFDNITLSEFCYPPLTTVHIPRDRIGHTAFDILVPETVKGKPPGREVVIEPLLVVRESTAPARSGR